MLAVALAASLGCSTVRLHHDANGLPPGAVVPETVPRELSKTVLPAYSIEPPDILAIDAVHVVPREPYFLRTLDVLEINLERSALDLLQPGDVAAIQVPGAFADAPIDGFYPVQPSGVVDLGVAYGPVKISGLTIEKAKEAIERHLRGKLREPLATVGLAEMGQPIQGTYPVQIGGVVNLGVPYGSVRVGGLSVEDAQAAIQQHLNQFFTSPRVSVTLVEVAGLQEIAGEHLVGPDGTVTLGNYGSVSVVGLTLDEAKIAIERHLAQFLESPEVAVSVFAYNSKVYYIVTQGAGLGDGVYRFPVTGNETVLDAVAQINGLEPASSKRIWIARPSPNPGQCQILKVDWDGITALASTNTNYQILPGDRVFVAEDKLVALDTALSKLIAPVERIMGFSILGAETVTRFSGNVLRGGGNPRGTGTF